MKKFLLLLTFAFALVLSYGYAKDKEANEDELLRKSHLVEPSTFNNGSTSMPRNFSETTQMNTPTNAAISTGYYWIDDRELLDTKLFPNMRPNPTLIDTNYQAELWRKIVPGPRIFPASYWAQNKQEGLPFFRQPADKDFFNNPSDSTDDAIAGPMPIGIKGGFYFNGLRYDSFYVTTNGLIALTNRRYFYDVNGNRVIPAGATSCYDPMSMDWFAGGTRGHDTLWIKDWTGLNDSLNPQGKKFPQLDGNGYQMYKDGLNDKVIDNFGYFFSVLGADPTNLLGFDPTNTLGGVRARGGSMMSLNANSKAAIVAVFWGDLCLSQFEPETKQRDEHGMVFYKRTYTNDSLIVAFFNAQPKGSLNGPFGGVTTNADIRPQTSSNYVTGNAHVVFTSIDSSITIHFTRLSDGWTSTYRKTPAREVFRYNTTCGVRGFARHVNFGKGGILNGAPWYGEYEQANAYWDHYQDNSPANQYPELAVKFKQWQNTLRVADIQYRVRSLDPKAENELAFVKTIPSTEVADYELLAGHVRLGAVQPIALIQNLTNEIQGPSGVNFVKQSLNFRARFQIRNTITNRTIYNRLVPIDALCLGLVDTNAYLCNGDPAVRVKLSKEVKVSSGNYTFTPVDDFSKTGFNGVPPYYFVQIQFPPFEPNEFIDNHVGRMKAYIIAEPVNPSSGEKLRDSWPFDDSTNVTLFVMRRFYDDHPNLRFRQFEDDGTEFHVDTETNDLIPSAFKWVSINTEMVSGNLVSKYPLPPRRIDTNDNYFLYDTQGARMRDAYGNYLAGATKAPRTLKSPVIKMNRVQMDGFSEPLSKYMDKRSPARGGDEIRSFPIDLRAKKSPVLSLSVQRTTHQDDWPRGFADKEMVGPEPRVIIGGNPLAPYTNSNAACSKADEICVEYAKPSDDGIESIANIPAANWRHIPYRRGDKAGALTDMAALTVFGGGGYLTAFLEGRPDSTLSMPGTTSDGKINSLRADMFDDGIDLEYKKFSVPIPDTFIVWKNDGAKYFRFRIKVYAAKDGPKCIGCIEDDKDDFYVDNVKILYAAEITDIEVSSVKVLWPYTVAPASQATAIPLQVRVSNNTDIDAPNFSVKVKIYRVNALGDFLDWLDLGAPDHIKVPNPIYCRTQNVSNLIRRGTLDVDMPSWNARKSQADTLAYYRLYSNIVMNEPDLVPKNDSTYSDFTLRFGKVFAYDPATSPTNNVPQFVGPGGKGLNFLFPTNRSGGPRAGGPQGWDQVTDATGSVGGNGSGAVAVKFRLLNTDTLRGFSIYWGGLNRASDQVTFTLYEGQDQTPNASRQLINITTTRGGPNFQNIYDSYVDYIFSIPQVLPRGTYWIGISQDGETGFELGASGSRSGMKTTNFFQALDGTLGEAGICLNVDKNFRKVVNGDLQNDNFFAYQNVSNTISWNPFTPTSGNPAFGHLNHYGQPVDGATQTMTRGSWIPMMRPYFGNKSHGDAMDQFEWCPDDITPVELVSFDGSVRNSGIDLFWETASEINNFGYYVERRVSGTEDWSSIGFVAGSGNSTTTMHYTYFDGKVTPKVTYDYRLRQVDKDGVHTCSTSNIITLTYDKIGGLTLEQNSPNPFVNSTSISFTLPSVQNVKLEVVDMFGNVVRTLENGTLGATNHFYTFDGMDANGNQLSSGQYIYRLTGENEVLSGKMSIVR